MKNGPAEASKHASLVQEPQLLVKTSGYPEYKLLVSCRSDTVDHVILDLARKFKKLPACQMACDYIEVGWIDGEYSVGKQANGTRNNGVQSYLDWYILSYLAMSIVRRRDNN